MAMENGVRTLRVIPGHFRSVLFADVDIESSGVVSWTLDRDRMAPHPSDFGVVPSLGTYFDAESPILRPAVRRDAFGPDRPREVRAHTLTATEKPVIVSHAAERVANAIVLATKSPRDPRTLNAWGQSVGVSRGALRVWCTAAGVSARSCLEFARVLRAVILSVDEPWDLLSILDVVDQRSIVQLLDRGGVSELCLQKRPSAEEFMARQHFIEDDRLLRAVARRLKSDRL